MHFSFDPPLTARIVDAWGALAFTAFIATVSPRDLGLALEGTRKRVLDAGWRDVPSTVLCGAISCWNTPLAAWAFQAAAATIREQKPRN